MDPPWRRTGIKLPYKQLSDKDIFNIPMKKLQKVGILFLWVTNSKLEAGLEFMKKHGYRQKEDIVWSKVKQNGEELQRIGYWLLHSHETCLVGFKGTEKQLDKIIKKRVHGNTITEQPRQVSQKPEKLYEIVEKMAPNGYYLEIFAKNHNARSGFVSFGNELT